MFFSVSILVLDPRCSDAGVTGATPGWARAGRHIFLPVLTAVACECVCCHGYFEGEYGRDVLERGGGRKMINGNQYVCSMPIKKISKGGERRKGGKCLFCWGFVFG